MQLRHVRHVPLFFGLFVLAIAIVVMLNQTFNRQVPPVAAPQPQDETPLTLTSSAFEPAAVIPNIYTCTGENINPPLTISNPPESTTSYVLVAKDRSSSGDEVVHWLVWNIPADTTSIAPRALPAGAVQGTTHDAKNTYSGPCSETNPSGTFTFELFAINDTLPLEPDATYDAVIAAINGKVVERTALIGATQISTQ